MRAVLTRNDKILITAVVLIATLSAVPIVAALSRSAPARSAHVFVAGTRVATLPLDRNATLFVATKVGLETLQVAAGKIRVAKSPCPRKICSHRGWVSHGGEEIVCVPGELVVRVEGGAPPGVDAVSR